jgi:hypothetical protein
MGADNHMTVVPRGAGQNSAETEDRPLSHWSVSGLQREGEAHAEMRGISPACVAAEARRELRRRGEEPQF